MKKIIIVGLLLTIFGIIGAYYIGFDIGFERAKNEQQVTTFDECVASGGQVLESYPPQCKISDQSFTQEIGNELNLTDLIVVDIPRPNQKIASPLSISGKARGTWFFEASFPIELVDDDGNSLGIVVAQAGSDWMTEEFVPFTAELVFTNPGTPKGTLIFKKDNPSGLPQHDNQLEMPVAFGN